MAASFEQELTLVLEVELRARGVIVHNDERFVANAYSPQMVIIWPWTSIYHPT